MTSATQGIGPRPSSTVRLLLQLAGALLAIGVVLAVFAPLLGLPSTACSPINCGALQMLGKIAASAGIGLGAGTLAVDAALSRRFPQAALAGFVALSGLIWATSTIDLWRQQAAGTDEVGAILAATRAYAPCPADDHPILINGRENWATVRTCGQLVLLLRENDRWVPKAKADSFSRDDLIRLGAPTDIAREAE